MRKAMPSTAAIHPRSGLCPPKGEKFAVSVELYGRGWEPYILEQTISVQGT